MGSSWRWSLSITGLGLLIYEIFFTPYPRPMVLMASAALVYCGMASNPDSKPSRPKSLAPQGWRSTRPIPVRPTRALSDTESASDALDALPQAEREWYETFAYREARWIYETTGDESQLAIMLASMDGPHTPDLRQTLYPSKVKPDPARIQPRIERHDEQRLADALSERAFIGYLRGPIIQVDGQRTERGYLHDNPRCRNCQDTYSECSTHHHVSG